MEKQEKTIINVAEILAPIIGSRDVMSILEQAVLSADAQSVDLDFSDVEFVSRSAAHALLIMKEDVQRKLPKKKFINFINTNSEVQEMLRIVAANRALPKRTEPELNIERTDINSLIKLAS